jgi:hypothetical protein
MHLRSARSLFVALVAAAVAPAALGQIIIQNGGPNSGASGPGLGTWTYSDISATGGTTPNLFNYTTSANSRIDWNWQLPRNNLSNYVSHGLYLTFTVNPLPVSVSSLFYSINGKWVNGGGNGVNPTTTVNWRARIGEFVPFVGNVDVASLTPAQPPSLVGNGLMILNQSDSVAANYVLAAGRTYTLAIDLNTYVDVSNFAPTTPSISVTNEFGGPWAPSFGGMSVGFNWQIVPAPSTAGLLALAGLAATRRRR